MHQILKAKEVERRKTETERKETQQSVWTKGLPLEPLQRAFLTFPRNCKSPRLYGQSNKLLRSNTYFSPYFIDSISSLTPC